jgi:uncharacterized membrane protein YqaE (UPF0057 family)
MGRRRTTITPAPPASTADLRLIGSSAHLRQDWGMKKILLIVLCFVLPPLAVLLHEGLSRKVLWALLWQLLGHFPGVIYGILVVTKDRAR